MACPHIATGLAESRNHVATKTDRGWPFHGFDRDGRSRFVASQCRHDRRRAVRLGNDTAVGIHLGNLGVKANPGDGAGLVLRGTIHRAGCRDELSRSPRSDQRGARRRGREGFHSTDGRGRGACGGPCVGAEVDHGEHEQYRNRQQATVARSGCHESILQPGGRGGRVAPRGSCGPVDFGGLPSNDSARLAESSRKVKQFRQSTSCFAPIARWTCVNSAPL